MASAFWTLKALTMSMLNDWGSFPLIDLFHGTGVAYEYRERGSPAHAPLQRVFAIVITALGGTMLTGFLLGQPPSWLCYSEVIPAYCFCWFIMERLPREPLFRLIRGSALAEFTMTLLDDISWGIAITSWGQDKATSAQHEPARASMIAALLCGVVSGCGGGVIQRSFGLLSETWAFTTPLTFARCPSPSNCRLSAAFSTT